MRRGALLVAVVVLALFLGRGAWLPLVLPEFAGSAAYLGYVEGDTMLMGPVAAGRLVARPVERGQMVAAGALLFAQDAGAAQAQLAQAEAAAAQARAQADDLLTGKRPAEMDVTRAQLAQAEAAEVVAAQELARAAQLVRTSAMSASQYDQAVAQQRQTAGRVAELRAQLAVGELGGRAAVQEAAQAGVRAAEAAVAQARVRLADLSVAAPVAGIVQDVFYDRGEFVPAGAPVLALLPPGRVKLRFFVPEGDRARASPGAVVRFRCDGCAGGGRARVTYVATQAEYTPPVIYSQTARSKLVYLVEARPEGDDAALVPGMPVQVLSLSGAP